MRERGLEFKVGLLIIAAAVVLVGFVFVLGNFSLKDGFTIYVEYDYSGNLQEGAPVKVAGIKVGKIESISFYGGKEHKRSGHHPQIVVEAWIENDARHAIKANAEYYINTAGVLGEQYLEINPDPSGAHFDDPPIEAGVTVVGKDPARTDLVVARLYEVLENLSVVLRDDKETIRKLLQNSASAVATVDTLLKDNKDKIGTLLGSVNDLTVQASTTLSKVNDGIGDPRIIRQTIVDADHLLVASKNAVTQVTPEAVALLDDAQRVTAIVTEQRVDRALDAADKAATAAAKAGGLIDNVDGMVTDLRAGKGTAGALLVKEELYADLRELISDLKRNPWKFFWKE